MTDGCTDSRAAQTPEGDSNLPAAAHGRHSLRMVDSKCVCCQSVYRAFDPSGQRSRHQQSVRAAMPCCRKLRSRPGRHACVMERLATQRKAAPGNDAQTSWLHLSRRRPLMVQAIRHSERTGRCLQRPGWVHMGRSWSGIGNTHSPRRARGAGTGLEHLGPRGRVLSTGNSWMVNLG